MPIHNSRSCSNTLYIYANDLGSSLKGLSASPIVHSAIVCIRPSPRFDVVLGLTVLSILFLL